MRVHKLISGMLILVFLGVGTALQAQHGMGTRSSKMFKDADISKTDFRRAVAEYIREVKAENNGYFIVDAENYEKELKLKLIRIHKNELSYMGDDTYFVCSDFKGVDGNVYDIDIFMKGTDADNLEPEDVYVHKVNEKPLYTWKKVIIFERSPMKEKAVENAEKPENTEVHEADDVTPMNQLKPKKVQKKMRRVGGR